jgi:hypothetical protein
VEIGQQIEWRISSLCGNGGCVAVAKSDAGFLVRDSKDDNSPVLRFTTEEWSAFVSGVKADEFWSN